MSVLEDFKSTSKRANKQIKTLTQNKNVCPHDLNALFIYGKTDSSHHLYIVFYAQWGNGPILTWSRNNESWSKFIIWFLARCLFPRIDRDNKVSILNFLFPDIVKMHSWVAKLNTHSNSGYTPLGYDRCFANSPNVGDGENKAEVTWSLKRQLFMHSTGNYRKLRTTWSLTIIIF